MSAWADIYKSYQAIYTEYMTKPAISLSSDLIDNVKPFLLDLGLNEDQVDTYLYLLHLGSSSVLALAKAQGSGRTRLYPVLESLVDLQLVKVDQKHYGTTYEALTPRSLEFLVTKKETETKKLRDELSNVTEQLSTLNGSTLSKSKVVEYRGVDGLKQINFNLTKANKEFFVFEGAHLDSYETMPKSFVDRMRKLYFDNKLMCYDLTNDKNWHKVKTPFNPTGAFQKACYIDEKVFKIRTETYIYNNVVAYLGYEKDEPFGVEIYNQDLAEQQKQLFKILWANGTEINSD